MKVSLILLTILGLTGCVLFGDPSVKQSLDEVFVPSPTLTSTTTIALPSANFQSDAHPTSGKVEIVPNGTKWIIQFSDFKTDSGPDLYVYVSQDRRDIAAVNLGKLKALSGSFYYELDEATLRSNSYVVIWCKLASVTFGSAKFNF